MSGTLIPPPAAAHACQGRPSAESVRQPGTIWKCDDCGKESVIVSGSQYNETYYAWREADKPTYSGEYRGPSRLGGGPDA